MHIFDFNEGIRKIPGDKFWYSFMEKEDLEFGVLHLKPGQEDTQSPHKSDEVYFILEGNGSLVIDDKEYEIKANTIYFVPKNTKHKFQNNSQDIRGFYVLN